MKAKLLISAVVLGIALPLALPVGANAADTPADTANKSASVDVSAGDLTITKTGTDGADRMAPSFLFGSVSANGQKGIKATGFDNKVNTDDTYKNSVLSVDDNSGSGAGWHVTAKLGAFSTGTTDGSHTIDGASLNMIPTATKSASTKQAEAPSTTLEAGGDDVVVFNAEVGAGLGTSTTDFKGSTLDLPAVEYTGTYTAPLTYTLTSGPQSNPTA